MRTSTTMAILALISITSSSPTWANCFGSNDFYECSKREQNERRELRAQQEAMEEMRRQQDAARQQQENRERERVFYENLRRQETENQMRQMRLEQEAANRHMREELEDLKRKQAQQAQPKPACTWPALCLP